MVVVVVVVAVAVIVVVVAVIWIDMNFSNHFRSFSISKNRQNIKF